MTWRLVLGDCVEQMRELEESSVDAIVTDPPYGLEFMGKEWDRLGNGFRRRDNPADIERDDPFGRASRTSPEYRAGLAAQSWHTAWAVEALRVHSKADGIRRKDGGSGLGCRECARLRRRAYKERKRVEAT